MKRLLFGFVCGIALIPIALLAKVVVINSNHAAYDGHQIVLKGSVVVDHAAGVLTANRVVMKPKAGKDGEFETIDLNEHVWLRLCGGGELLCHQAHLNLIAGVGTCLGNNEREYVVFHEYCTGAGGEKIPVTMKSRELSLIFLRDDQKTDSSLQEKVQQIEAREEVTISYNHDFIASGNRAIFYRQEEENASDASSVLPGQVVMTGSEGAATCQVTNQRGDLVYAKTMTLDTTARQLEMENMRGTMVVEGDEKKAPGVLSICADRASWEEKSGIVTLLGNVEVNDPDMGLLKSKERIILFMDGQQPKQWVRAEAEGESTLIYKGKDGPGMKTLKSYGSCVLDHSALEVRLNSPKDGEGKVLDGKQVFYTDERGDILADQVSIHYRHDESGVSPERIVLYGHVKIVNRDGGISKDRTKAQQYVLADRVDFFPATQLMELKGTKGRRVLFFDEANELQVSAQVLKVRRDRLSSREMVEGGGDVRFYLVDQEIEKLRQQFSLDRIVGKTKDK